MNAAAVQSVLRCGQCNKPFDKQSSLKRHGYYCRSRRKGSAGRPRACIPCAKGKAGCDHKRPACSRCATKGTECYYPSKAPRASGPDVKNSGNAPSGQETILPPPDADATPVGNGQEARGDSILDGALVLPDPDFANFDFETENITWNNIEIDLVDLLTAQTNDNYHSSGSSSLVSLSTPPIDQASQVQQGLHSPLLSIPAVPSLTVRSLIQRPRMQTRSQRIANLILHTLKSYPLMTMRHNTLPPFIHPSLVYDNDENINVEPLTNCISLVQMIGSGVNGTRRFFWKNVRLECERLSEEHLNLSTWELVAAMQALSMYILIRMDEGETDYNNFDFLLMKTVTLIAQQLNRSDGTCNNQRGSCNNARLQTSWKEWIFRESRRRLAVVYRVVNMLMYFEPAAMCDMPAEFILAPLPARRQLWEASDDFAWKMESQREPGLNDDFGMTSDGNIVKLGEGLLSCSDSWLPRQSLDVKASLQSTARWEEWCSGIDGFGGLIMLAASFIE